MSPNGPSSTSSTPQDYNTQLPSSATSASGPSTGFSMPFTPTGPMTLDPSLPPSDALNPRSCVVCRKRKVRCDKHMPCSNCRKAQIQCIFPAPGRAPRRPRPKDPNAPPKQASEREIELMKRLRKLEGIVEDLSGQIEFETAKHPGSSEASPEAHIDTSQLRRFAEPSHTGTPISDPGDTSRFGRRSMDSSLPEPRSPTTNVRKDFGRLVLNEKGNSKYVSNAFWSKVNDEINALKAETQRLTDGDSEDSDDGESPQIHSYGEHGDHHGFVLGYKSSDADLSKLHPLPSQIPFIWQVYVENVDPLIKILHIPTMTKVIREARTNMANISHGMEALLFSIYYAAITSMEPDEVKTNFGSDKATLVNQYRFACEQALAKADFLTTTELIVAQAFMLFLALVRRHDDTRFAWSLTSLAVRIGHSLGLHRDGTNLSGLKPFDIEMRRRMWWALCVLDLRSAEDQGTDLIIGEGSFDTRLPLNINDTDITPESTEFPPEREGPADSTFFLVRAEICVVARRMHMVTSSITPACIKDAQTTVAEREALLQIMYKHIQKQYFQAEANKNETPLHWVAATITRMIMAKLRLIIYQPLLSTPGSSELGQDVRDRLYEAAVEVVEYTKTLNSEKICRQWRWLFQTYTQWHAVAYVLLEVIRREWNASTERGWMALTATFSDPEPTENTMMALHSVVWIPLRKLMIKARRHREEELARLRADPEAALKMDINEYTRSAPASFHDLSNSVRHSRAQEQWRKLVGREGQDPRASMGVLNRSNSEEAQYSQTQQTVQDELQGREMHLDQAMSQTTFNPMEIFQAAFPGESSADQARQAMFGGLFAPGMFDPTGAPPQQQQQQQQQQQRHQSQPGPQRSNTAPVGAFHSPSSRTQSASGSGTPASGMLPNMPPDATTNPQAMLEPLLSENPPSWLWTDQWGNVSADGMGGNMVGGCDGDVDMEEDYNWQNWQDTLRGYDADNSLGIGRVGFTGGI